jgi:hypothetical protein
MGVRAQPRQPLFSGRTKWQVGDHRSGSRCWIQGPISRISGFWLAPKSDDLHHRHRAKPKSRPNHRYIKRRPRLHNHHAPPRVRSLLAQPRRRTHRHHHYRLVIRRQPLVPTQYHWRRRQAGRGERPPQKNQGEWIFAPPISSPGPPAPALPDTTN